MTGHSSPKAPWLRTRRTQLRVQLPVVFQNWKQCPQRRRDEGNGYRYLRVYRAGQPDNADETKCQSKTDQPRN